MDSKQYIKGLATVWPDEDNQKPQTVYFQPPVKKRYDARWLVLWQDGSDIGVSIGEQAKMEKPLTQAEYRVRDLLLSTIGIGNMVHVNQAQIGRELNLHPVTVCNAIKRLIELQIVIPGPKSGKQCTYMISPAFCFSGGLGDGIKQRKVVIKETKRGKVMTFDPQQSV